jgi:polyphosphate kinase 2 (PPK2 family)
MTTQKEAIAQLDDAGRAQFPVQMVVACADPRGAELLALFNAKDARGKECLIRMARCMPCGEGC